MTIFETTADRRWKETAKMLESNLDNLRDYFEKCYQNTHDLTVKLDLASGTLEYARLILERRTNEQGIFDVWISSNGVLGVGDDKSVHTDDIDIHVGMILLDWATEKYRESIQ